MLILPIFLPRSAPCGCDCHAGMPNGVATAIAVLFCALVYGCAWFAADDVVRSADYEARMAIMDARGWAWRDNLGPRTIPFAGEHDELAIFRIKQVKP